MLPPHWLDKIFNDIDDCENQLFVSSQFKDAISNAKKAYLETLEFQKTNPNAIGASPAQEAREVFLKIINNNYS